MSSCGDLQCVSFQGQPRARRKIFYLSPCLIDRNIFSSTRFLRRCVSCRSCNLRESRTDRLRPRRPQQAPAVAGRGCGRALVLRRRRRRRGDAVGVAAARTARALARRSAAGELSRIPPGGGGNRHCTDCTVAALARAGNVPLNVVDRPALFEFHFPGDRRSRRCGGGDRHRRGLAGAGAAPARTHRGDPPRTRRRACDAAQPLPQPPVRRARRRAEGAPFLGARGRRRCCWPLHSPAAAGTPRRRSSATSRICARSEHPSARCISSAPAPAIPIS